MVIAQKVVIHGLLTTGHGVPNEPGIYDLDDDMPARHVVRLADGRVFDLGDASRTAHRLHRNPASGDHVLLDELDLREPAEELPRDEWAGWLAKNYESQ